MINTNLIDYFFAKSVLLIFAVIIIYAVIKIYNKYSKLLDFKIDSELKQKLFEDLLLMHIAKEKGIDLKGELKKYETKNTKTTSRRFVSNIIKEELQKLKKQQ